MACPAFHNFILSLLLLATGFGSGRALQYQEHSVQSTPLRHKCIIEWAVKEQIAHISFGVESCLIHCRATHADYRHTRMFSKLFNLSHEGGYCNCRRGNSVLGRVTGKCGEDSGVQCFGQYALSAAKSIETDGSHAWLQNNPDMYKEDKFKYSCEKNACENGCALIGHLPGIGSLKTHAEKDAILIIKEKAEQGQELNNAEQEILEEIEQDVADGETQATDLFDMEDVRERTRAGNKTHVVFVVDMSGSMGQVIRNGSGWTRMYVLKSELKQIITSFTDDVSFNMIAFDHTDKAFRTEPVEANNANKQDAFEWISSLGPAGGTRLDVPLRKALSMPGVDVVYLLTDGMTNNGCAHVECLIPEGNKVPVHTTFFAPGTVRTSADEAGVLSLSYWLPDWLIPDTDGDVAVRLLQSISDKTGGVFRIPF